MKNITKNNHVVFALIAVFALATTIGTTSVFATHASGVVDYEWHIWSRTAGDGHTSYLNCNGDNCDLKVKVISGVQTLTINQIKTEVGTVESHFDSLGKKMSIDKVTTANSYVTQYNLPTGTPGKAVYELHCTNPVWWWCNGEDMHFEKMIVQINNNAAEVKFKLAENQSANPKEHDVRKTLGHELFHAMGIDHNSASNSIVYYQYQFGATNGYAATTTDKNDLGSRYP